MTSEPLNKIVQNIRTLADSPSDAVSDRHLLERFARRRDEAAFTTLVHRHGQLVLGVCRRVLRQEADAEDAFQAAFLVLARKAGSVPWQESVGNWLYGVAYRIAHKLRTARARRQRHEQAAARRSTVEPAVDVWGDLQPVLDEELHRLPVRFRMPLVLCYLEGCTQDEAAKQLGWSLGSLRGRLWRGRDLLRERLARRGLPLAAVLFALALSPRVAPAAVPTMLASLTIRAGLAFAFGKTAHVSGSVLGLAKGILHTMFLSKLQTSAAILAAVVFLGGVGLFTRQVLAGKPDDGQPPTVLAAADTPKGDQPKTGDKPKDGDKPKEGPRDEDRPKEGPRDRGPVIRGTIKEVHAQQKLLTVVTAKEDGGGEGVDMVLDAAEAKITLFGQAGQLSDLQQGMAVFIQVSKDSKVANYITANWAPIADELLSVDPVKNTLTIIGKKIGGVTYELAKDALILVDDFPGPLADLGVPRTPVILFLAPDRKTVRSVMGHGKREVVRGTIQSVDAGKNTVTVQTLSGNRPTELTFDVSQDATILVDRKPGKLSDVAKGTSVLLRLSADNKRTVTTVSTARADGDKPKEPKDGDKPREGPKDDPKPKEGARTAIGPRRGRAIVVRAFAARSKKCMPSRNC